MLRDNRIWIGTSESGPVFLLPQMANRHGLISGASGTGKTICLKVLAEAFSDMGIPVLATDTKEELSGMLKPGIRTDKIDKRWEQCGINAEKVEYKAYPVAFWDAFGQHGHPLRLDIGNVNPLLLARMLELNEVQTEVLYNVFRYCQESAFELDDLGDLRDVLRYIVSNIDGFSRLYGKISPETIGVILRQLLMVYDRGGNAFFGRPEISILDWMRTDNEQRGYINIINSRHISLNYYMYSSYLVWILTELNRCLPERGDADRPAIVLLLDEADMIFKYCSKKMIKLIDSLLRQMRSKGVGVYMQVLDPLSIPDSINRQLSNRIMLSMNAYTPYDQRNLSAIAEGLPQNPRLDIADVIKLMKKGEGLVSFLNEAGAPGMTERVTFLPPQSQIGPANREEVARAIAESEINGKYDAVIDYPTASEKLAFEGNFSIMDF